MYIPRSTHSQWYLKRVMHKYSHTIILRYIFNLKHTHTHSLFHTHKQRGGNSFTYAYIQTEISNLMHTVTEKYAHWNTKNIDSEVAYICTYAHIHTDTLIQAHSHTLALTRTTISNYIDKDTQIDSNAHPLTVLDTHTSCICRHTISKTHEEAH